MVKGKKSRKSSFNVGDDVLLSSMFEENFNSKLEQLKDELEKERNELESRYTQYETEFNGITVEEYVDLAKRFLEAVKLQGYPTLKQAMTIDANRLALNKAKDFRVLFVSNNDIYNKVLTFIAQDELVSEAISNYITDLMLEESEENEEIQEEHGEESSSVEVAEEQAKVEEQVSSGEEV